MKILNLPEREEAVVTTVLTTFEVCGGVVMRGFTLADTPYSLEEAPAIEGFLGYVHTTEKGDMLHNSAVYRDARGLPRPVTAVCFIKPKE
jgi:hypothetical protein